MNGGKNGSVLVLDRRLLSRDVRRVRLNTDSPAPPVTDKRVMISTISFDRADSTRLVERGRTVETLH